MISEYLTKYEVHGGKPRCCRCVLKTKDEGGLCLLCAALLVLFVLKGGVLLCVSDGNIKQGLGTFILWHTIENVEFLLKIYDFFFKLLIWFNIFIEKSFQQYNYI